MRVFFRILLTVLVPLGCVGVEAQSVATARISGLVTDSQGAAVPGTEIQFTQTETGLTRTVASSADGTYSVSDLPTGPYELRARHQGFNTFIQSGIVLGVAAQPTINVVLTVGQVTQEVVVTTNTEIIETHSASLGQVVENQEVLNLPLNARDPMQLLTLTPSAVVANSGSVGNYNGPWMYPNPFTVAFSGTVPGAGNFLLDGGNGNSPYSNGAYPLPFPDALQEFKVETNAVPARYGMHSAATVNAITKSGTNRFHGSAFEFVRNYVFNARSYFAPIRDNLKRNQFGGTLGGPVKKDRLFFFGAVQQTNVRSSNPNNTSFIPTAAELNGDFSAATSAGCNGGKPVTLKGSAFPGGTTTVSPAEFSAPAVALAQLLPQTSDPCGRIQYGIKTATNATTIVGRGDYRKSDRNSLFTRYFYASYSLPPDKSSYLTLNQADQDIRYNSVTLGHTFIINNATVNSFHANLNRAFNFKGFDPSVKTPSDIGVQGFYNPLANYMSVTVNNFFNIKGGTAVTPALFNNTVIQFSEDFDSTKGPHQFSAGANYVRFMTNLISPVYVNGTFTFSNQATGYGMSDFLLGDLFTLQQGNIVPSHGRKNYIGLYAQDSWQLGRKLTLNYGVRWEPFLPVFSKDGEGEHFNEAAFESGTHSNAYPNAPAGLEFPGKDYSGFGNSYLASYDHFEPRVGLSYDPRGKGMEVIRASYGTFYDFEALQNMQVALQSPPWADTITLNSPVGGFSNPWQSYLYNGVAGNPYPIVATSNFVFPAGGVYESTPSLHVHAPNLQQWNASLQKQIGHNLSVTATYIGNKGTHLWVANELNPAIYIPGVWTGQGSCGSLTVSPGNGKPCSSAANVTARRRLTLMNTVQGSLYSSLVEMQDNGTSSYNAGVLSLQRRMNHNFSFVANYTLSHCIDTGETTAIIVNASFRNSLQNEVGNCSFDHRHQLTVNGVLHSPSFENHAAKIIAGGWQLAPLFSYLSGDWLTVTTGTDTALMGVSGGQRPNQIGDPKLSKHTPLASGHGLQYFNTAAFALPTIDPTSPGNIVDSGNGSVTFGALGNLRRDTLTGPSVTGFDMALTREFSLEKRGTLQARAEAFNVFNWTRLYDPGTTMGTASFGQSIAPTASSTPGYSTAQDPRIMQFALKYSF